MNIELNHLFGLIHTDIYSCSSIYMIMWA